MSGICTPTAASVIKSNKDRRTYQLVPTSDRAGHGLVIFCVGRPHNGALRREQRCASHPDFESTEDDAPRITTFDTGAWKARPGLRSELNVEVDQKSSTQSPRAIHSARIKCSSGPSTFASARMVMYILITPRWCSFKAWHAGCCTTRKRAFARLGCAIQPAL